MSCPHAYEYDGQRSYGANIPGYAQGAYFPGDEPGTYCKLSGERCANETGETPLDCEGLEKLDLISPIGVTEKENGLFKMPDGKIVCESGFVFDNNEDLLALYSEAVEALREELAKAGRENERLERENRELKSHHDFVLGKISGIIQNEPAFANAV